MTCENTTKLVDSGNTFLKSLSTIKIPAYIRGMAATQVPALCWNTQYLRRLLARKKVLDRTDLAKRTGIPYSTICVYFDGDWSGLVQLPILATMAVTFNVHPGSLIADPREAA